jgi:diguanylate cyclase (GGDEF)-like protein
MWWRSRTGQGHRNTGGWVRRVVQWYGVADPVVGLRAATTGSDELAAILDGMDAAVVAVRTGGTRVITNMAARKLYALPDNRPIHIDDLACWVQIFHAHRLRRLGTDDLPLIRALAGRLIEIEVIVVGLDPDGPQEMLDPVCAPQGRRLSLRAKPLFGHGGEVVGSVCTAYDVTAFHHERAVLSRRTAKLLDVYHATRAILTEEDARRAVCEAVRAVSGALLVSLYEPDGRGDLVCTTHRGADLLGARLWGDSGSVVAEVFASGLPRVLQGSSSFLAMGQYASATGQRVSGRVVGGGPVPSSPPWAAVWLPVTSRAGECLAVLSLVLGPGVPVYDHLPVLETLVGETAVAIERQDLLRRLRHEASFDGLTGAANRRVWDEELPRAIGRARRDGTSLAMIMLDLDHFKEYNDAYGHPAGDALLREVVSRWGLCLHDDELLCRYGGEEFVVLLPGYGLHKARILVEQLRAVVPDQQTCSAGVAVWDGQERAEDLVARLDAALYAAKVAGRDRVRIAG